MFPLYTLCQISYTRLSHVRHLKTKNLIKSVFFFKSLPKLQLATPRKFAIHPQSYINITYSYGNKSSRCSALSISYIMLNSRPKKSFLWSLFFPAVPSHKQAVSNCAVLSEQWKSQTQNKGLFFSNSF